MPPKVTKESKAAKLRAARAKAQKWREEEKNKRKREPSESPTMKTRTPTRTPVEKRRKRDENGPNGTPNRRQEQYATAKTEAPSASKKTPKMTNKEKLKLAREKAAKYKESLEKKHHPMVKEDAASKSSASMEIDSDDDITQVTVPVEKKSTATLTNKEKIQLARKKAAKLKNEKLNSPVSSSSSSSSSTMAEIKTKRSRRSSTFVAPDVLDAEMKEEKAIDSTFPAAKPKATVSPTDGSTRSSRTTTTYHPPSVAGFPNTVAPSSLAAQKRIDSPPKAAAPSVAALAPTRISPTISEVRTSVTRRSSSSLSSSRVPVNTLNQPNYREPIEPDRVEDVHTNFIARWRANSARKNTTPSPEKEETIPSPEKEETIPSSKREEKVEKSGKSVEAAVSLLDEDDYHDPIETDQVDDIDTNPIARWRANVEQKSTLSPPNDDGEVNLSGKKTEELFHSKFLATFKRYTSSLLYLMKIPLLLCAIFFGLVFAYVLVDSAASFMRAKPLDAITPGRQMKVEDGSLKKPTCFIDTANTPENESDVTPAALLESGFSCENNDSLVPCPTGGICYGGYLQTCYPPEFLEPSNLHSVCQVSKSGKELIAQVKKRLVDMSVEKTCGCWSNVDSVCLVDPSHNIVDDNLVEVHENLTTSTMFRVEAISDVFGISYYTLSSISSSLLNHDIVLDKETKAIGLSDSFLQKELPIPSACYAALLFVDLFAFFLGTFLALFSTFLSTSCYCLSNYPKTTILGVLTTLIAYFVRRSRNQILTMRNETRRIRELAYAKLRARGGSKYSEKHLRDDIVHDLCPDSLKMRKELIEKVWPRVVKEVRCDSRIQRKFNGGMEWWEWADLK